MMRSGLFTIGHSDLSATEFVLCLRKHGINAIADVRSAPYSRWHPQFNKESLAIELGRRDIRYVFLGAELGARRSERECYVEGIAKYQLIANTPLFQQGLHRIRQGLEKHRVSLMCAEKDPLTCHRAILICRHLKDGVAPIQHILEGGELETHENLESRLLELAGLAEPDLFQSREEMLEQAYDWQSNQIAYQETKGEILGANA